MAMDGGYYSKGMNMEEWEAEEEIRVASVTVSGEGAFEKATKLMNGESACGCDVKECNIVVYEVVRLEMRYKPYPTPAFFMEEKAKMEMEKAKMEMEKENDKKKKMF